MTYLYIYLAGMIICSALMEVFSKETTTKSLREDNPNKDNVDINNMFTLGKWILCFVWFIFLPYVILVSIFKLFKPRTKTEEVNDNKEEV